MKRLLNILLASLLSLMVVYLSVGTTVMHCLRSNEVKVVMGASDCCAEKCEGFKKHCMDYKHLQLSPTLSIQKADFDASPIFAGILPASWMTLPRPVICHFLKASLWYISAPHAPPRAYLAFINVLMI